MSVHTCCDQRSVVTDTRETAGSIRRRRKCPVCGKRWTTLEVMAVDAALCLPGSDAALARVDALLVEVRQAVAAVRERKETRS